jgi:hypothetical protein
MRGKWEQNVAKEKDEGGRVQTRPREETGRRESASAVIKRSKSRLYIELRRHKSGNSPLTIDKSIVYLQNVTSSCQTLFNTGRAWNLFDRRFSQIFWKHFRPSVGLFFYIQIIQMFIVDSYQTSVHGPWE